MMTLMNLVYALPVVLALVIAGAVVNARVPGTARTLMWSGIALVSVTRLASLFLPWMVTGGSAMAYGMVSTALSLLSAVGVVLLVVAVGAAARGTRGASTYPGQPGWQGQGVEPSGFVPPSVGQQNVGQPSAYPGGYGQPQGVDGRQQPPQQTGRTNPGGWTNQH